MNDIFNCVEAFSKLLDIKYNLVIGRKSQRVCLSIEFDKKDCFHLMGLQYLVDKPELRHDRGKIFDSIKSHQIVQEKIENSEFYQKISYRINLVPYLEFFFDNNDTIFKYNQKINIYSMIKADYLMKNKLNEANVFIFLDKNNSNGTYFCRSFFPQDNKDYTVGQARYALLYKEKVNKKTGEIEVQLNRNDICHFMKIAQKEYEAMVKAKLDITVQSQTESEIRIRYFASDEQAVSDCLALANKESQDDFLFRIVTEAEHKKLKDAHLPFDTKRTEKGIVIRYSSQLKNKIEKTLSPPRGKQSEKADSIKQRR